jgi:hypothetical protein
MITGDSATRKPLLGFQHIFTKIGEYLVKSGATIVTGARVELVKPGSQLHHNINYKTEKGDVSVDADYVIVAADMSKINDLLDLNDEGKDIFSHYTSSVLKTTLIEVGGVNPMNVPGRLRFECMKNDSKGNVYWIRNSKLDLFGHNVDGIWQVNDEVNNTVQANRLTLAQYIHRPIGEANIEKENLRKVMLEEMDALHYTGIDIIREQTVFYRIFNSSGLIFRDTTSMD